MAANNTPKAPNYKGRAKAEPTALHQAFAEWLEAQTGIKPDLKTVQLVCSMRMDFQKSPENQAHLADRRTAAQKKADAAKEAKIAKAKATLAKLQAEIEEAEAPKVEVAETPEVEAPKVEDKPVEETSKEVAKAAVEEGTRADEARVAQADEEAKAEAPEMQEKDGLWVTKEPKSVEEGVKIRKARRVYVATIRTYATHDGSGAQSWATYTDGQGNVQESNIFKIVAAK